MKNRKLKVYGRIFFCLRHRTCKIKHQIILQGDWLENAGFAFGDSINVEVLANKMIVTKL
jgi:hypothetical protein